MTGAGTASTSSQRGATPLWLGAAALLALGVAAWVGLEPDDAPSQSRRVSSAASGAVAASHNPAPGSSPSVPVRASVAPELGPSARSGWIPASAREATPVMALRADPANDPLCQRIPTPIELGKAAFVALEGELREATRVTDAEESKISRAIERDLPKERELEGKWDRPADVRRYGGYLDALVRHLAAHSDRPSLRFRVHLIRDPAFNAAALPGGLLMINTGVLSGPLAVRSEAELAAVLAHEIAHVDLRHCMAAFQYARAILGEDVDEATIALRVLRSPIQSELEHEADEAGGRLALRAQYNPQAAVDLWRRHAAEASLTPSPGLLGILEDGLTDVFRSHPPSEDRACRAMERVEWARGNTNFARLYDGQTNLSAHVIGATRAY